MDDERIETNGSRSIALALGSLGVLAGLLLIVLPLYAKAEGGGYGWALSQYPSGIGTRQTIAFALSWFSPVIVGLAAVLALAAGSSARVVAGAFLALGATAAITFVTQILLVWTDLEGWRAVTSLALVAISAGLLVAAGLSARRAHEA